MDRVAHQYKTGEVMGYQLPRPTDTPAMYHPKVGTNPWRIGPGYLHLSTTNTPPGAKFQSQSKGHRSPQGETSAKFV